MKMMEGEAQGTSTHRKLQRSHSLQNLFNDGNGGTQSSRAQHLNGVTPLSEASFIHQQAENLPNI